MVEEYCRTHPIVDHNASKMRDAVELGGHCSPMRSKRT